VGFDALPAADPTALELLDYAVFRMRIIMVDLGIGRVGITRGCRRCRRQDDLGSEDEADDLIAAISVPTTAS
jgi:hypothetical protein